MAGFTAVPCADGDAEVDGRCAGECAHAATNTMSTGPIQNGRMPVDITDTESAERFDHLAGNALDLVGHVTPDQQVAPAQHIDDGGDDADVFALPTAP